MTKRLQRFYAAVKPILEFISFAVPAIEFGRYVIPYFLAEIPALQPTLPNATRTAWAIQTTVIVILAIYLSGPPGSQKRSEYGDAIAASWQFVKFWRFLWGALLTFYVVHVWSEFAAKTDDHTIHLVLDSISLVATGAVLLCYITLAASPAHRHPSDLFLIIMRLAVVGVALIGGEAIGTHFDPELERFFDGAQGMIAGIVTALFVGRIESKFFDSSRWIIIALYGYAVLQLAYPILEKTGPDPLVPLAILSLALILKVLLFWHVQGLIISGRLTYYMFEYRKLTDDASNTWVRFTKEYFPPSQSGSA